MFKTISGLFAWRRKAKEESIRRVVGDKIYDTAKAELIAVLRRQRDPRVPPGFSFRRDEHLYLTENGNWFLYHKRLHPMQGGYIEPVTQDEVFTWLYRAQEVDLLAKYFPDRFSEA